MIGMLSNDLLLVAGIFGMYSRSYAVLFRDSHFDSVTTLVLFIADIFRIRVLESSMVCEG